MIDSHAARVIAEQQLPRYERYLGTTVRVLDEKTTEYEWGWMFFWDATDLTKLSPEQSRWGRTPYLVDRVTGLCVSTGTSAITRSIEKLFEWRYERLCRARNQEKPDLQDAGVDYPSAKQTVERYLPGGEHYLGTPVQITDDRTREYEWGWAFSWHAVNPSRITPGRPREGYSPYLVDRVTGVCLQAYPVSRGREGESSLAWSTGKLLAGRELWLAAARPQDQTGIQL